MCQRRFEIVRKRRRDFVVFRRMVTKIRCILAQLEEQIRALDVHRKAADFIDDENLVLGQDFKFVQQAVLKMRNRSLPRSSWWRSQTSWAAFHLPSSTLLRLYFASPRRYAPKPSQCWNSFPPPIPSNCAQGQASHSKLSKVFFTLRLSRFFRSLSIVNSPIQCLVLSGQIERFQRKINYLTLARQNILRVHRLFQCKPSIMLWFNDHAFLWYDIRCRAICFSPHTSPWSGLDTAGIGWAWSHRISL